MKSPSTTIRVAATFGPLLAAALLGATGHAAAQSAGQSPLDASARFEAAMTQYEQCRWPQAYAQLAALADASHPQAARVALLMSRFGPALYGTRLEASAQQRQRWLAAAAAAPQTVARLGAD